VGLSIARTYEHILRELKQLPSSNQLTRTYCTRFCGILIVDAKYIKVRGYFKKIPFIFGIDYLTHDIVCALLAPSENQLAYEKFFGMLRRMRYPMRMVCADDNGATRPALARIFPRTPLQLCQNHYLENIRQLLKVRTDETHQAFFFDLKRLVFDGHTDFRRLRGVLHHLLTRYALYDPVRQQILVDIERRKFNLFAYTKVLHCPKNTNLIELYNSHLNGRLKTIKGFKSFASAARWLNAYVVWRRTKTLTDCGPTFKHLNGHCSLELTIKKQALWPEILGLKHY
jgi:transposase-like protein